MDLKAFILDTRRDPATGKRSTTLLGNPEDVKGKHCVILDDVADTMGVHGAEGGVASGGVARGVMTHTSTDRVTRSHGMV